MSVTDVGPEAILEQIEALKEETASLKCDQCAFVAKTNAGLVADKRSHGVSRVDHSRSTVPSDVTRGEKEEPEGDKPTMDETVAWINENVQPGILRIAAMTGIPKPMLAELVMDNGVRIWEPKRPTSIGKEVMLDETTVQVYAAAYVYGQDTWLATQLVEYGKKVLPIALCGAVAIVTLAHIAKVVALRQQLVILAQQMAQNQAEAQQRAEHAAQQAAAEANAAAA